tara:strand:- start:255 stop:437 length:183 start_codon:yes stop_codon:yes gene_type:complete
MIFKYLKKQETLIPNDKDISNTIKNTKLKKGLDYLKNNYQNEKMGNLDEKHKEWKKKYLR